MSENKDTNSKQSKQNGDARVNLGRHQAQCTICRHPDCEEIEEAWIAWGYTGQIAKDFDVSRDSIYRHARAVNLYAKRRENSNMICEKVLERVDWIQFSGSNYISMLKLYLKIHPAEKEAEAARPSDPKTFQPETTPKVEASGWDGLFGNLVQETASTIPQGSQGDTQAQQSAEGKSIQ